MLTNILNTLAITCSLGTSVLKAPKQEQKNTREMQQVQISLDNTNITELPAQYITEEGTYIDAKENGIQKHIEILQNRKIATAGYIRNNLQGTITYANSETRLHKYYANQNNVMQHEYRTLMINNDEIEEDELNNYQNGTYAGYLNDGQIFQENTKGTTEELIFIEIETNNLIYTNSSINLSQMIKNLDERYNNQDNNRANYYEILTTQSGLIQNYINTNDPTKYWKNNSLYEKFNEIKFGVAGFQTASQTKYNKMYRNITTIDNNDWAQYELKVETDLLLRNKTKQYVIIYIQPQLEYEEPVNEETGNNLTELTGYTFDTYYSLMTVNINTNVLTPTGTYEVVDIGGVMFDVLGMPFTFISTAFNLTIFPGTPYELNLSILFLSIIAIAIFVFIVRIIAGVVSKAG